MDLGLAGKTVIVTGGGSNIGRGIVLAFAGEGANIVNADLDEKQAQKTVDDAKALGGHAVPVKTDVTDWDSVQAMVKKTLDTFGGIDVLVNNVGWSNQVPFVGKPDDEIEKEISLNYWSVINCTRAVADHMVERKYGKIVNISSDAGRAGVPKGVTYSGTKGAVIALSKALARELGRYGININTVCPGWIVPEKEEDAGEGSFWHKRVLDSYSPEYLQKQVAGCAIRRLGSPRDIANMVVFLASDCASYITGQTISVDGGLVMM